MSIDLFPLENNMLWFSFHPPEQMDMFPVDIVSAGRISTAKTDYRITSSRMREINPLRYHSLQYSIKGTGRFAYTENGVRQEHPVPPGHLFLMSHDLAEYEFWFPGGEAWEWFFIVLRGELADRIFKEIESRRRIIAVPFNSQVITSIQDMIGQALNHTLDAYAIQQLGCSLLINLKKAENLSNLNSREMFVRDANQFIQSCISEVNVEKLAEHWGYSTKYFQNYFRGMTGKTPGAYILNQRLDYARMLLKSSGLKISAIAEMAGFTDASHLCKAFKHAFSITPAEFRHE